MESDIKAEEHFKSQFKAYQDQQQRRLQNLMETKKEKQNSQKGGTGKEEETFRIPNDLNLFETEQPVNEDDSKRSLEVENKQLQDQLREVQDENCRLYKLVREKDFEMKQLQKKMQEDRLALSGASGLAGDVAATKIVELAKRNRELTAETESEKAKVKQLNNKVKDMGKELQAAVEKLQSLGGDRAGIKQSTLKMIEENLAESPEVKALQDKLTTANFKVMEYRNQLQSAKQELKLTQKLLANEVGEDVNIQSLMTNSSSWRGRAQQILVLQSKVRELENQLGQSKSTSLSEADEEFLAVIDPRKLSAQEKNLLRIRSLEKEKKETLEKLTREHDALQKSHEELKKKLDASKARNKVLCSEVKTLKEQIVTLLEKGKHDNELIDALLNHQKQMQEILKDLSQQDEKNRESQQMPGHHNENQNYLIEQLRQTVAEREAKVQELQEEIGQLTFQQKQAAHQGDSSGDADPPPDSEHSEDPGFTLFKPLTSDSNQVGRTGSVCTVSKMGHTLVESAAAKPFFLNNNVPPGRLVGTDSPDSKELRTQIAEHKALCQAAEVERGRLLELVTVLQERVEEGSSKVLEAEKRLQEERWRCAILEQQLAKVQMDSGKNRSAEKPPVQSRTGQPVSFTLNVDGKELPAAQLSHLPLEVQIQKLSSSLMIQQNENKALKAALETTLRRKKEDFKLYQDTVDQVKEIFIQAIQQQKQEEG